MHAADNTTNAIIMQIESLGFYLGVHRMRDYVEMHAVSVANPEGMYHLARWDGGDGDEQV